MRKEQTTLNDYVKINAKNIIDYLIKLIEYQENVKICYSCKKIKN